MKISIRTLVGFLAINLLFALTPACSKHETAGAKESNIDHWTCTMHPSVHSKDPGKCPICSMDLVPVEKRDAGGAEPSAAKKQPSGDMKGMEEKKGGGDMKGMSGMAGMKGGDMKGGEEKPGEFQVPVERQQQIGVTYATVGSKPLNHTIRAAGKVAPDTQRLWRVVARAGGYVQELGVSAPGEIVKKGQVLMTLYSPELLTTQRELIDLLRMRDSAPKGPHSARADAQSLIESAERRLCLWNVTDEQVAEIEKARKAEEALPILSKMDGIVQALPVTQGMTIAPGNTLVDVADLSVVWVWGEFYQEELPMLQIGQEVTVTSASYPGEEFKGKLSLIDPFINDVKRTGRVRLDIQNPELKLKPDMYVDVLLQMEMGQSLVVPVSAIMPTGKRNIAFVDKGEGKLEPRFLELGGKFGDVYAVKSGVQEGERVVASANFLIDAESKIQGAVKNFEGAEPSAAKPAEPQPTQPEPTATRAAAAPAKRVPLAEEARTLYDPLLSSYFALQTQLARDRFEGVAAQTDAIRMQLQAISDSKLNPPQEADVYRRHIQALQASAGKPKAGNLDEAREQFAQLSFDLLALLTQFPPPLAQPLYTYQCPMRKEPNCWLQASREPIENPFMGSAMPACGKLLNTVGTAAQ